MVSPISPSSANRSLPDAFNQSFLLAFLSGNGQSAQRIGPHFPRKLPLPPAIAHAKEPA